MMLSPMGHAALVLATEHGLPVFPCVRRKKDPIVGGLRVDGSAWRSEEHNLSERVVGGGFHRATTHPEPIGQWWTRWPDANIGVRLGSHLRLCLIEADTAEADAFLALMAANWQPTWTYRASRGLNRLFRAPNDLTEKAIRHLWPESFGKGVELKTGRGFLVAPPSVHPSGHTYTWTANSDPGSLSLADLPVVIVDEARRIDAPSVKNNRSSMYMRARMVDKSISRRVTDALRWLDADDYATWRDVGLALKNLGDAHARVIWDAWSQTSSKFNAATQDAQWQYFREHSPDGGTITVASIFHYAGRAGWRWKSIT
jgi:hypothetical protein